MLVDVFFTTITLRVCSAASLWRTGASETVKKNKKKNPKTNPSHKEAERMLQIPTFIFAIHINKPRTSPPILFIHGFILRTVGFIVGGGSPLGPFMSNGKEREKKKLTKWAVAGYRLCFSVLQSFAELFHQRTDNMAQQQLLPAVVVVDSQSYAAVAPPPLLLAQPPFASAVKPATCTRTRTRCWATVWKRGPMWSDRWGRQVVLEELGVAFAVQGSGLGFLRGENHHLWDQLLIICKDGWGRRGFWKYMMIINRKKNESWTLWVQIPIKEKADSAPVQSVGEERCQP